ncbi:uncharacterized protein UTRI_04470_B [Ustilago trichophora]|uniref:Uncharacterized protein n=1 Tax=Ustilago trichophora TaxID=86804 RepID=A0A5C3ECZ2_9BASI|nr:uncharacterized protein UTRI_04470_B [Ustilago trichophora]
MPRTRPKASKLALTLSLFYLSTLPAHTIAASSDGSSSLLHRRTWRPDTELPGAPFILGDGKNEGSKVKGYEGEWPLWASFRESKPALDSIDAVAPAGQPTSDAGSKGGEKDPRSYVCAPIGECEGCPEDVIHLPYCRPYNNRRRVACSPVTNRDDPKAIQAALDAANAAKTSPPSFSSPTALLGWEACGKSAKREARDYFEMIAVVASVAIFSIWAFIQRQKFLFNRQNQQLHSRVTGQRRSSGLPASASTNGLLQGNRKKRSARLAVPSHH